MKYNANETGKLLSINISTQKGTPKKPTQKAIVNRHGIIGDAHSGTGNRQVSLLSIENIRAFEKNFRRKFPPGTFAENLTTEKINLKNVSLLDIIEVGNVRLEVTQIGKECQGHRCAIFKEVGKCVMPTEGIFTRVKKGGTITVGDEVKIIKRSIKIMIITLSDRAYRGEYEDKSGEKINQMISDFFKDKKWNIKTEYFLIPDSKARLKSILEKAKDEKIDVIFTTGGTGIGTKDITPDIAKTLCNKEIPGIMEYIRIKYGEKNPKALLSRSLAGIMKKTLVYTLPGSVSAVCEYLSEILKTLEHSLFMINDIDVH